MSDENKPQRFMFVEASVETITTFDPERPNGIHIAPSDVKTYRLLPIPEGFDPPVGAKKQVFEVFIPNWEAHLKSKKGDSS